MVKRPLISQNGKLVGLNPEQEAAIQEAAIHLLNTRRRLHGYRAVICMSLRRCVLRMFKVSEYTESLTLGREKV